MFSWFRSTPQSENAKPTEPESACPVDHSTRSSWISNSSSGPSPSPNKLSTARETSSIPRFRAADSSAAESSSACPVDHSNAEKWVYPSPSQFYNALQRKNRSPNEKDMDIVVPIHNAVNEKTWETLLAWERREALARGEVLDERRVALISFVGKPKDISPKARIKTLIGYTAPFDRHDWRIARPDGTEARYVIDFYTGRSTPHPSDPNLPLPPKSMAFYLDVRPALDDVTSVKMRLRGFYDWCVTGDNLGRKRPS